MEQKEEQEQGEEAAMSAVPLVCPICRRHWPAGRMNLMQLNAHVDACLAHVPS